MKNHWQYSETEFNPAAVPKNESLFALGNGYIGIRGSFEEDSNFYCKSSYINGLFDTEPMVYAEPAFGYARERQRMLPIADGTTQQISVNGEALALSKGRLLDYNRTLSLNNGVLARQITWESAGGAVIRCSFQRLVSFRRIHSAAFHLRIKPVKGVEKIGIHSALFQPAILASHESDPRVGGMFREEPLLRRGGSVQNGFGYLHYITRHTGIEYICAFDHDIETKTPFTLSDGESENGLKTEWCFHGDYEIRFSKFLSYFTNKDVHGDSLRTAAEADLEESKKAGFYTLKNEQQQNLRRFWSGADVQIDSGDGSGLHVRFSVFHLLQAAATTDYAAIGVKGLTGHGYDGHYFWDTEIYMLPLFIYTVPERAKALLRFRYNTLDRARMRARELEHTGALYPWRTLNGDEASPYYPAGTAQYHINADIIYALHKYVSASGDIDFLLDCGAEMIFEIARFWEDFGAYIPDKGFCLNGVTGPDEYTAIVDNNAFTNFMVKDLLEYACSTAKLLQDEYRETFERLQKDIGLKAEEIEGWRKAAAAMYLPVSKKIPEKDNNTGKILSVIPQDDTFLDKETWDFNSVSKDKYPLLLHYHPLNIYRMQVLKQPDLVLALLLQSRQFSPDEKRQNFDYYDPLTTGDSSLSSSIQSIIAAETGYPDMAYSYFRKNLLIDIDDTHNNTKYGIHAAAMGGTWLGIVYGFGGFRDDGERISFAPHLPVEWNSLCFTLRLRSCSLQVRISREETVYSLKEGKKLTFLHNNEEVHLQADTTVKIPAG